MNRTCPSVNGSSLESTNVFQNKMPQPNVSKKWKVSNVSRKRARATTSDDDSAQAISGKFFFYQFYLLN